MSPERIRIFPQTESVIVARMDNIRTKMETNTSGMGDMGGDGDQMDDPLMFKLHEEREQLEKELRQLQSYLSGDVERLNGDHLQEGEGITVGHEVVIRIKHSDGERENLTITIGSTIDKVYLGQEAEKFSEENILISEDSILAQALMGHTENDEITFSTPSGEGTAKVVSVRPSTLLNEGNE